MDRRARVEAAARQIQDHQQQAEASRLEQRQCNEDRSSSDLDVLKTRLDEVARDLRGSVLVNVGQISHQYSSPRLTISVSHWPTWLVAPYRQYVVTSDLSDCGTLVSYDVRRVTPIELPTSKHDALNSRYLNLDSVTAGLENVCAELIVERANLEYQLPLWYVTMGQVCAWPLAGLTWILCILGNPLWGTLLGGIPASLVYWAASYLWLPGIIALAFYL